MEKDLRLRLVVRRHAVPDVKLLWNVTANDDLTISKLLALVNDVVPLESGEWGLEDYAVELKDASGDGFECVHYHLVSKVLKDDDQVIIRPLLTGDLKRRRLSGRHQISADGKHLVDGLAFGRPWLRAPRDRPTVSLPPRKKARITYVSEDEEDSPSEAEAERPMLEYESTRAQEDPSSVQLRTRFYDADLSSDSEADEDDFEPAAADDDDEGMDSDNDDIQDELRMLREDNAAVREGDILEELRNIRDRRASSGTASSRRSLETSDDSPLPSASNALVRSGGRTNRFQLNLDTLDKIAALRAAFPSAQVSTIERALLRYGANFARVYRKLNKTFESRLSLQQTLDHQARSLSSSPIRHANSSTGRELVLRESSPLARSSHATSHDQDEEEEEEEDSDEASETLNHNAYADRASIGSDETSTSDSESGSDGATSESDEEIGNASENDTAASSSDDESDSESSEAGGGGPIADEDDSDSANEEASSSDDVSSSDNSSSDESSVASAKDRLSAKQAAVVEVSSDSSSDSSSDDSSSEDSSSDSEPEELPSKTLSTQRIRFESQEIPELQQAAPVAAVQTKQDQPDVPPGQGLSKTQKRNARRKLAKKMAGQKTSPSAQNSEEFSPAAMSEMQAAFLARKQALLNAIASDGPAESSQEKSLQIPDFAPQDVETSIADADMMETSQSPVAQEAASQRRMKPNVGAARRMLMGSLGLKNPKNKADEDKIRQDLMKGVRPHTNARLSEGASQPSESAQTQESVQEDPEAWREKIAYRAVECCHDGVELSEPPFPFAQRWDPQQQVEEWFGSKNKRGGKRKRVQRDQAQYHENADSQSSKKRRVTDDSFGVTFSDAVESAQEGDTTLNYDDPSDDPPATKKSAGESQATDIDDLPSLPSDLSTLPDLRPGEAKLGMVVTWKQLVLSSQTNWQPQVVSLTGVLVRIYDEDASDLEFILAHRDRGVDRTEKTYDEETGERVYDRFEAPDDDEDDEDAENELEEGHRRVNYLELIEPKVVQFPLEDDTKQGEIEKSGASEGESGPTDSVIHETIYDGQSQLSQLNGEISGQSEVGEVGSQSNVNAKGSRARANTDEQQPQVVAGSDPHLDASADGDESSQLDTHLNGNDDNMDEGDVPTPRAKSQLKDDNTVPITEDDSENSNGNALSISSDRRHEISIMIEEAGFRKDVSPSVIRHKTSSPSRQLLDQLQAANTPRVISKSPLSQDSVAKNVAPGPDNSGDAATKLAAEEVIPPPSSVSSIRSGRQLDPDDFGFSMGGDDTQLMSDAGHGSPSVDASTPRAQVRTPTRDNGTPEPNSGEKSSLPSLESLFKTASQRNSQKNTQSQFKSQVLSATESRKSIVSRDEEYDAAMRQIDEANVDGENEVEEDESPNELGKTRKKLFPNSSQPEGVTLSESPDLPDLKPTKSVPSSFVEVEDIKPRRLRERVRTASPFVVPPGSQVVTLSSSPPSSPLEENYAEDDVDEDYEENNSSSLPRGSGWVQKSKPAKANPRAKSVPAARGTAKTATVGRSVPSSSMPARSAAKGKGPRKSSTRF